MFGKGRDHSTSRGRVLSTGTGNEFVRVLVDLAFDPRRNFIVSILAVFVSHILSVGT